jgi:hypothetical protein
MKQQPGLYQMSRAQHLEENARFSMAPCISQLHITYCCLPHKKPGQSSPTQHSNTMPLSPGPGLTLHVVAAYHLCSASA